MRHFFILGRNPNLSLAELNAVLLEQCSIQFHGGSVAIVECPSIIDSQTLMKRLGGTIKIGKVEIKNVKCSGQTESPRQSRDKIKNVKL